MNQRKVILFAGGGTGGHVYPALAIADQLKKISPSAEIHFVGTAKGIETRLVPKAGYPLHLISVSGLKNLSLLQKIMALFRIPFGFLKSIFLILKLRPHFVLGVGGYASGPLVLIASLLRCRTAIWEPNAFPGMTNRWLARFVDTAFVTHDEAAKFFGSAKHIIPSGMPLREGIEPSVRPQHDTLRVLVFGGSQGARALNEVVGKSVEKAGDWFKGVELVLQTGPADFEKTKDRFRNAPNTFQVLPFLYDMPDRYAWADLVISRSGAGTVAELAAAKKAAILVPFPFAADDHQRKNAEVLEAKGACKMVLQSDFTEDRFIGFIEYFKNKKNEISEMEERIGSFHRANSALLIAEYLIGHDARGNK